VFGAYSGFERLIFSKMRRTSFSSRLKMIEEDFKIRLARPDELPLIQDIERAAGHLFIETEFPFVADHEPMSIDSLRQHQSQGEIWLVVDYEDKPTGYAVIQNLDGLAHLHEISIHPAHGRKGLGKKLIQALCERAKQEGKAAVTLSTFRDVAWNAPYYLRLGFRILEEEELTGGLREIRERELQLGLPIEKRVCLRKEL
jgi:ribosomal protein S18 acetylase RimI-like enzyme